MPKSLIMHSMDTIENVIRDLSVINFNMVHSNHNQAFEGIMKLIPFIENAVKQHNIDIRKRPDLVLNQSSVYRLTRLWNETCYITIRNGDKNTETFHFDEHQIDFTDSELDIIPVPALDQFDLEQSKRDKSLLLKISELMPLRYAWEGLRWAEITEYGNFKINVKEGVIPTIAKDDMKSTTIFTSDISRHVYNRLIKKYKVIFLNHWFIILNNIQKILIYSKTRELKEELANESESVMDEQFADTD